MYTQQNERYGFLNRINKGFFESKHQLRICLAYNKLKNEPFHYKIKSSTTRSIVVWHVVVWHCGVAPWYRGVVLLFTQETIQSHLKVKNKKSALISNSLNGRSNICLFVFFFVFFFQQETKEQAQNVIDGSKATLVAHIPYSLRLIRFT